MGTGVFRKVLMQRKSRKNKSIDHFTSFVQIRVRINRLQFMVEPHDAEARRRGLAVHMALFNEMIVSQYREQDRQAVRNFLWQNYVEPLGGLPTLLQAPGLNTLAAAIERGADEGLIAGLS